MIFVKSLEYARTSRQKSRPDSLRGLEPMIELPIEAISITEGEALRCFIPADKFIEVAKKFIA